MIFAHEKGQMCNNLLQYGHVYAWAREHGRRSLCMRFSYKYPYFHIRHTRHCSFFWYLAAKYLAALRILPTANFKHAYCDHEAQERKMLRSRNVVVFGWYVRFYDLFLKYRQEITELFAFEPFITGYVEQYLRQSEAALQQPFRLGIHIRRGDYKDFKGGRYFYADSVYADYIRAFASHHADRPLVVYICSNDPGLDMTYFQRELPGLSILWHRGNPAQDLCLLSQCDALIGPPSTYSLTAAMYRDIPLCWMDTPEAADMQFDRFETLFQNLR